MLNVEFNDHILFHGLVQIHLCVYKILYLLCFTLLCLALAFIFFCFVFILCDVSVKYATYIQIYNEHSIHLMQIFHFIIFVSVLFTYTNKCV